MKRGFQSSVVTPAGITTVVCALITRELLAHDLFCCFLLTKVLCIKAVVILFKCWNCLTNGRLFLFSLEQNVDKWDRNK